MKIKQVLLLVTVALICGGIAGYGSARFADGGKAQAIAEVREIRFLDGSGNPQVTLEFGEGRRPSLILKDSTGRVLYDLPPSLKVLPAEGS
ncbi:MAG TPA: hypothetical protein VMW24_22565 [Sedimentisphaerales bacterium]|nr:hypothetical protein [Sedimentisphaerales bacterium]